MSPHPQTIDLVNEWLTFHEIDPELDVSRNSAGDWLSLALPKSKAESMLFAEFRTYRHAETNELAVRTLSYALPRHLHEHIDFVQPTTLFSGMRKMRAISHVNSASEASVEASSTPRPDVIGPAGQNISASCNTTITPTCLMQLYRTEGYVPQAAKKGNRIGINGFLEQVSSTKDSEEIQ